MEKEIFDSMDKLDGIHWWFRARRRIVLDVINRYIDSESRPKFLYLGIGLGAFSPRCNEWVKLPGWTAHI